MDLIRIIANDVIHTRMTFKNQKYFLEVDEATLLKIQALAGKSKIRQQDFQQFVSTLISKAYENKKGKYL